MGKEEQIGKWPLEPSFCQQRVWDGGSGWMRLGTQSFQIRPEQSPPRAGNRFTLGRWKQLKEPAGIMQVKPHLSYLGKAAGSEPTVFPLFLSQEISRREMCFADFFFLKKKKKKKTHLLISSRAASL